MWGHFIIRDGILQQPPFESALEQKKRPRLSAGPIFFGGGGWIRTTVGIASRFTVCPLWPLGNSSIFSFSGPCPSSSPFALTLRPCPSTKSKPSEAGSIWRGRRRLRMWSFRRKAETERSRLLLTWSWWTDSNPRPADYKSAALPTELHQRASSSTAEVILTRSPRLVNPNRKK